MGISADKSQASRPSAQGVLPLQHLAVPSDEGPTERGLPHRSAQLDALVNTIYEGIVAVPHPRMSHNDLQEHLYAFLTGGAQSLGYPEYYGNQIERERIQEVQAKYQEIKGGWEFSEAAWQYSQSGMWEGFALRSSESAPQPERLNKRYITLKAPKSEQLVKFAALLTELESVQSVMSVKVPVFAEQVVRGYDNIVVYFTDAAERNSIDAAIRRAGIQEHDRHQFYRSNFGVDVAKKSGSGYKSDTELASNFYMESFRDYLNTQEETGNTRLARFRQADEQAVKQDIAACLKGIFQITPPHREAPSRSQVVPAKAAL